MKALELPAPALTEADLRLYASRFYEVALEDPRHDGSVYTHHLLEALDSTHADVDGDACVGLLEAHLSAAAATSASRDGYQNPQWDGTAPNARCSGATHAVAVEGNEVRALAPGTRLSSVGSVPAGQWVHVDRIDTRRRWRLELGANPQFRSSGARPPVLLAVEAAWRPREDGGTRLGTRVGMSPPQSVNDVCFRGREASGRASWTGRLGPVAVGPQVEAGWVGRTPLADCDTPAGPAQDGVQLSTALRGEAGGSRWYGAIELGGAWVPRRSEVPTVPFEPVVAMGLGIRL